MQASTKQTLCQLVEDHVSSLVREAVAIQRHTKRAKLKHTLNNEGTLTTGVQRALQAEDINLALQSRGDEKMLTTNAGGLNREANRIDLNAYLVSEPKYPPPSDIGMTVHWLAVDGVQPSIPQNPVEILSRSYKDAKVHKIEEEEENDVDNGSSSFSVRQLLPRLLAEELRLYFNRVTLAVERGGPVQQDSALTSVAEDSGTQELVPFFTRYISTQIYHNIDTGACSRALVRLAYALISNPNLHIELNLHQILPPLISCVVARRLSSGIHDNHWQLRYESARTLAFATEKYAEQYSTLKARLIKTLCEAIQEDKGFGSQFGGIVGISCFGPKAVDSFILPLATEYWTRWEDALAIEPNEETRFEIQRCQDALLNALASFFGGASIDDQSYRINYMELSEVFGDRITPLQGNMENSEYMSCII